MIYTVTSLDDAHGREMQAKLLMAVGEDSTKIYDSYAPRFFLVDFDGPVRALGEMLGMDDEQQLNGFVARLPDIYFGYANAAMWEWVAINRSRSDEA